MPGAQRIAQTTPDAGDLRREVRALTHRAHRMALAQACATEAYEDRLAALFDTWMATGDGRQRVVCFATAAQFGLDVRRYAESCRQAATCDGGEAVRMLYLAAARRLRSRWGEAARRLEIGDATVAAAARVRAMPATGESPLCAHCARLRHDSRRAGGHGALRPAGDLQWRSLGGSAMCETRAHQCMLCRTDWMRHRTGADPFVGWTISRRPR